MNDVAADVEFSANSGNLRGRLFRVATPVPSTLLVVEAPRSRAEPLLNATPAYRYADTRFGVHHAIACLYSADVKNGHVALFIGATGPYAKAWIQVGVMSNGGPPHAYAETAGGGYHDLGAVPFGKCLRLGVIHTPSGSWNVSLDGRVVRPRRVRLGSHAVTVATSETYGRGRMAYRLEAH